MKTTAEKIAVMQAFDEGKSIELRWIADESCVDWFSCPDPDWNWSRKDYRIAAPKPDYVPWSAINEEYRWYFRDPEGRCFITSRQPDLVGEHSGGFGLRSNGVRIDRILNVKIGSVSWVMSLQERPVHA